MPQVLLLRVPRLLLLPGSVNRVPIRVTRFLKISVLTNFGTEYPVSTNVISKNEALSKV